MRSRSLVLLSLLVLLVLLRAAAPAWLRARIEGGLEASAGGGASVEDVDLCLLCGGYAIEGVRIRRAREEAPPLVEVRRVELGLDLERLREGAWIGRMTLHAPSFHLRAEGEAGGRGLALDWAELVAPLYPLPLGHLRVRRGALSLRNRARGFELFVRPFRLEGRNLDAVGPAREGGSVLEGRGRMMGEAPLRMELEVEPDAERPAFRLRAALRELPLESINPYLESTAALDASGGLLSGDLSLTGSQRRYEGRAQIVVREARWLELPADLAGSPLELLWQGLVQAAGTGEGPLRVTVPLSGTLEGTEVAPWQSVGTLLRRAVLALATSPLDVLRFLAAEAEEVAP